MGQIWLPRACMARMQPTKHAIGQSNITTIVIYNNISGHKISIATETNYIWSNDIFYLFERISNRLYFISLGSKNCQKFRRMASWKCYAEVLLPLTIGCSPSNSDITMSESVISRESGCNLFVGFICCHGWTIDELWLPIFTKWKLKRAPVHKK